MVGAMNAYEDMTGENISSESKDAATNELVVTSKLADQLNDSEKAVQYVMFFVVTSIPSPLSLFSIRTEDKACVPIYRGKCQCCAGSDFVFLYSI